MNGDDDDTLTLAPTPNGEAFWGRALHSDSDVTEFNINGGTLALRPPQGGALMLGAAFGSYQSIVFNIRGAFSVRQTNVAGNSQSGFPRATFNIYAGGKCSISEGGYFTGSLAVNVNDLGSMIVSAHAIKIEDGTYVATGIADADSPSLELIAWRSLADPYSGNFDIARHRITCKSSSVCRLQATSMSYTASHIRAEETASLLIACDAIDLDSSTVFAVGQGSAAITFAGSEKNEAPFDIINNAYPKGLFNFIATEGANTSTFRFLNIGSAFEFNKLQAEGVITINGAPDTQYKCDWRSEADGSDKYFVIFLKSA